MFDVHVHQDGKTVVVAPSGELDLVSAHALGVPLAAAAEHGVTRVVLDLRELTFVDSSGIGLILKFRRHFAAEGIEFALIRGEPRVQRTFALAHVEPLLPWTEPAPR
ncbi:MAG TPA: STAS domain-containing protein [Baekduia sp.]|nr:STAS domain-containing protein [Baekduia sp.]